MKKYKITEDALLFSTNKKGEIVRIYIYAGHKMTVGYGKRLKDKSHDYSLVSITGKSPKDHKKRSNKLDKLNKGT